MTVCYVSGTNCVCQIDCSVERKGRNFRDLLAPPASRTCRRNSLMADNKCNRRRISGSIDLVRVFRSGGTQRHSSVVVIWRGCVKLIWISLHGSCSQINSLSTKHQAISDVRDTVKRVGFRYVLEGIHVHR